MTTTTTIVCTAPSGDVERALPIPSANQDSAINRTLFFTVASLTQFCTYLRTEFAILKILKIVLGFTVTALSLIAAWWALDLAKWTSAKDYREDCRETWQTFNVTTPSCEDVLNRPLEPPPSFVKYLGKATYGVLGEPKTARYRQLASKAAGRGPVFVSHDELDEGDSVFWADYGTWDQIYLRTGVADLDCCDIIVRPMDELTQDQYEGQLEFPCDQWINSTAIGTIEVVHYVDIPSPKYARKKFESVFDDMPPSARDEWRAQCTYKLKPGEAMSIREQVQRWIDDPNWQGKISGVLGVTFFVVVMAHEIWWGGFARKTTFKWQEKDTPD
jgi:hypothetical protein